MKKYTVQEVAATIDHAVLKPDQTEEDVRENAQMCQAWGFGPAMGSSRRNC